VGGSYSAGSETDSDSPTDSWMVAPLSDAVSLRPPAYVGGSGGGVVDVPSVGLTSFGVTLAVPDAAGCVEDEVRSATEGPVPHPANARVSTAHAPTILACMLVGRQPARVGSAAGLRSGADCEQLLSCCRSAGLELPGRLYADTGSGPHISQRRQIADGISEKPSTLDL